MKLTVVVEKVTRRRFIGRSRMAPSTPTHTRLWSFTMGARDVLRGAVAACLVLVTVGCLHVPPLPVKVQEEDVRFLRPGTTTRDDVLQRLGPPNILDGTRVGVYEWRTLRGIKIGLNLLDRSDPLTGSNQSRLLVEFDEAGKVRHFTFAEYHYSRFYYTGEPPGDYFVDGSARELLRPAAPLLKPSRSLGPFSKFWFHYIELQSPALAVSRDGRYVAVATFGRDIQVWDLSSGGKRTFASGFWSSFATALAVSRDGKVLAAVFEDATVLWDMASGQRLHVLGGHGKSTWFGPVAGPAAVAFALDGGTVATGGRDGTVKLWDVASGKEASAFRIGGGTVQSLAFAPRGDLLAAGTSRGDVSVMDLTTGQQARLLRGSDALEPSLRTVGEEPALAGRRVAFSPSGRMLAATDCVAVALWRASDIRAPIEQFAAAAQQVEPSIALLLPYGKKPGCPERERTFLAFAPGDEVLIASSNLYSVWDLGSQRLLAAWNPSHKNWEPADLTLDPGAAVLVWQDAQGKGVQILNLAPLIREAMDGAQGAGSHGAAR